MKNVVVFIFIALITLINTKATIKISTPTESTCEGGLAKVTLKATLESTSLQSFTFNMTLVDDGSKEYMVACRVEYKVEKVFPITRILNYNKRKLKSTQVNCEFNQPEEETTLTLKENSVLITDGSHDNNVIFDNSFSV